MDTIRALLRADQLAVKRWFSSGGGSKLIVVALFCIIFGAIALGLFLMGNAFFRSLATFETYGLLTAGYLIHAAIIIILWIALGSSVTSSVGLLISPGADLSYLMTLPIPRNRISLWIFAKTILANTVLMLFVFLPVMASYAVSFHSVSAVFFLQALFVLFNIILLSSGAGMAVALVITTYLRNHTYSTGLIGMVVFFCAMLFILKSIFPPELSQLYSATPSQFAQLFSGLPLNNPMLPTAWLAGTITGGFTFQSVLIALFTAGVLCISVTFQNASFMLILLSVKSKQNSRAPSPRWNGYFLGSNFPLVIKHWLSIARLAAETGYGLFLSSVALFFFVFVSFGTQGGLRQDAWRVQLTEFSFGWLLFFTIALVLRFLYPLIGREGKSAWLIGTMPVTKKYLLSQTVLFSLIFSIIPSLFAALIWSMLPFVSGFRTAMTLLSILVICTISIVQTLLGAIAPDFSKSMTPEKASTSGMGLITLGVSSGIVAAAYQGIHPVLLRQVHPGIAVVLFLIFGSSICYFPWLAGYHAARRYEWK